MKNVKKLYAAAAALFLAAAANTCAFAYGGEKAENAIVLAEENDQSITAVEISGLDTVLFGEKAVYDKSELSVGEDAVGYSISSLVWIDKATGRQMKANTDSFTEGNEYYALIGIRADSGYRFDLDMLAAGAVGLNGSAALIDINESKIEEKEIRICTKTITATNSITLKFNGSGAEGSMEPIKTAGGQKIVLPECAFEAPEGKVFVCWKAGNSSAYPGDEITTPENRAILNIYARWEMPGDIDMDGEITDKDAKYLLKYLGGTVSLTRAQTRLAMVTDDGENIDMLDVIAILLIR